MSDYKLFKDNNKLYSGLINSNLSPYLEYLWDHLIKSNFTGYDPGSFHSQKLMRLKLKGQGIHVNLWNNIINYSLTIGGYQAIKILKLPKIKSTKALALAACAIDELCKSNIDNLENIHTHIVENIVGRWNENIGAWAPDFDYQIKGVKVTKSCIGTINTVFSFESLWRYYKKTKEEKIGDILIKTSKSLKENLHRYEKNDQSCFSYNPMVNYYVHNANLFVCLLMARAISLRYDNEDKKIIEACIKYTLNDIETYGLIRYAGPPTINNTVDNYHTGYVLRTLKTLTNYITNKSLIDRCNLVIRNALKYYTRTFVTQNGVYKFPKEKGPIQAHSLAESILIYEIFSKKYPEYFSNRYKYGIRKAFNLLWDKKNKYFLSEVWTIGAIAVRKNNAPMPRWAWAWMFYALASLRS